MAENRLVVKFVPADQSRGTLAHWAYWFEWEEADGTPVRQKYLSTVPLEVAETIVAASTAGLRAHVDAAEKKVKQAKLIKASPKLLEACKELLDIVSNNLPGYEVAIELGEAAIREAEGDE